MAGKPSLRGAQNCLQIRGRVIISRVMIKNVFGAGTLLPARHPQIYKSQISRMAESGARCNANCSAMKYFFKKRTSLRHKDLQALWRSEVRFLKEALIAELFVLQRNVYPLPSNFAQTHSTQYCTYYYS